MQRRYLRPNSGSRQPTRLVFVDCETRPDPDTSTAICESHSLWFGCSQFCQRNESGGWDRERFRFGSQDQFWSWLAGKQHRDQVLWLFAHNLAFDATVLGLWEQVRSGEWEIGISGEPTGLTQAGTERKRPYGFFVLGDPPTIVKMRRGGRYPLVAVDTLNYFPVSLARLGERIGLEKLDPPTGAAPLAEWESYCERDVRIISVAVRSLLNWHREQELGNWSYTAAGIAMSAFRHSHLKTRILLHTSDTIKQLERDGHYGGRLELFRHGVCPGLTYKLDVNSLYPSIMRTALVPIDVAESRHEGWTGSPGVVRHPETTIADVLIESDRERFPLRTKAGLIFPVGRYWTTLTGPELARAYRTDSVRAVGRWCRYKLRRVFADYVDRFHGLRLLARRDGEGWKERLCKMLLNSLYGKFGQLSSEWEIVRRDESYDDGEEWSRWSETEQEVTRYRAVLGYVFRQRPRVPAPNSFPAISAWITALARERMAELIATAGEAEVRYLVTDAICTSQLGFDRLLQAGEIDPDELGKLKVEAVGLDADFRAIHWYRVGAAEKRGSLKPTAKPVATSRWEQDRFERLAGIVSRRPDSTVRITRQTKGYLREYRRGELLADGSVRPLRIDNPEPPESMVQDLTVVSVFG